MYGGSRQAELLGDVWRLDLSQTPILVWSQIKSSWPPRAGHTTVPLNSSTFLVYGGQTNDQRVASLDYVHLPNRLGKRAPMESTGAEEEKGGLNGGAIAGIVIGICVFLAIAISVIVWTRRQQQRRLHYFHSRSTRFSLSTPPPSRPTSTRMGKTTSLPEMSHIVAPEASRLSTLSFGSDFRIPIQQQHQQQQDNRASFSSVSVPQSRFDTRTDSFMASLQYPAPAFTQQQRRESSGSFKRLTLNISSALRTTTTRDETTPSPSILKRYTVSGLAERRRSSMMFGLRASRFLHIPGSNNNDASTSSSISNEPLPRMSYDARSVSSVQWVGFNDTMDYREQQWSPNVQLAVTNQQRRSVSSSRPTSYAAESVGSSSSPRSAVFRFSNTSVSEPYRLSIQEIHSWEDHLNHRIMRTRLPPSSSSLPSRTIERFNNYRISTDSSDEGSIVVASGTATTRG
ncbi:hypothetical protein BJV82DRAFT_583163 [Fennellomyces sp. T-0311]|nr:hypothetical protein BJV82DRAFT_583163 [Fennellomyces sp. T-0311]